MQRPDAAAGPLQNGHGRSRQASFQVLKIINVNGSRRGGLDCFLDGTNYNHIHWCPPTLAALTKKGNVITDTRLTYTVHGNEF